MFSEHLVAVPAELEHDHHESGSLSYFTIDFSKNMLNRFHCSQSARRSDIEDSNIDSAVLTI